MKALKPLYAFLLSLVLVGLPFAACNETDDGSYVAPITSYEKMKGTWELRSIKQVDEIAKASSQNPSEMVLTDQFDFATFTIALNVDVQNLPTTYQVSGSAPALFPNDGYWELDNPFPNTDGTPSVVKLYSDAAKTKQTGSLSVTAIPGATQVLELKLTRKTKGVPFVSYSYQLIPVTN